MFNPIQIIKNKRDNKKLSKDEIEFIISGYLSNSIPEYQVSAFLMAIYFNGLDDQEIFDFTNVFIESGQKIDLSSIKLTKVDKHSTGGVGDKTSIILAPLVASLGLVVPMMSGRGLGHTGGTLDKLRSIPGFNVDLNETEFIEILTDVNVCMIGQTITLAPADKKIYALRDVTATVESIGLITSSIVSKKITEGTDIIVYDVKVGSGSTLKDIDQSVLLAHKLINVSRLFGKKSAAILTDMNEPLGYAIGNYLEIKECVEIMKGDYSEISRDLINITLELAAYMLMLAGKANSIPEGREMARNNLNNGKCLNKFVEMTERQGGDIEFVKGMKKTECNISEKITSEESGFIVKLDAMNFGLASVILGGGRIKAEEKIDHSVGIVMNKKVGDKIEQNELICEVFGNDKNKVEHAVEYIRNGISVSNEKINIINKIIEVID